MADIARESIRGVFRCRSRGEPCQNDIIMQCSRLVDLGEVLRAMPITRDQIFAIVSRIPRGRVATYGQVARLAGIPGQPRLVGYALSALGEGSRVPWHRVVNAAGE